MPPAIEQDQNTLVLKSTSRATWQLLILSIIFLFLGLPMVLFARSAKDVVTGLFIIIAFSGGCIFTYVQNRFAKPELLLNKEGFSLISFGQVKRHHSWHDIAVPFDVSVVFLTYFVTYSLKKSNLEPIEVTENASYRRLALATYGMKAKELAALMNGYREAAVP